MAGKQLGRPSSYTEELGLEICERLAHGEPLTKICKSDHMPYVSTVYRWLLKEKSFCDIYARAREDQADTMADEIAVIADETPDTEPVLDKEGNIIEMRLHSAYVQWQKNRVDARKWVASKLKPKKYGDRQILAGDKEAPVEIKHSNILDETILNLERKLQLQNEEE